MAWTAITGRSENHQSAGRKTGIYPVRTTVGAQRQN
jgi:hypothetical protein